MENLIKSYVCSSHIGTLDKYIFKGITSSKIIDKDKNIIEVTYNVEF